MICSRVVVDFSVTRRLQEVEAQSLDTLKCLFIESLWCAVRWTLYIFVNYKQTLQTNGVKRHAHKGASFTCELL